MQIGRLANFRNCLTILLFLMVVALCLKVTIGSPIVPFSDVIVTDLFESNGSPLSGRNRASLALRLLFLDYLANGKFDGLTAYSRDRLIRVTSQVDSTDDIKVLLAKQFDGIDHIQKVNAVFYGTDNKILLGLIGGSDLIDRDYSNKEVREKLDELIQHFADHVKNLERTQKSDDERDDKWGRRVK